MVEHVVNVSKDEDEQTGWTHSGRQYSLKRTARKIINSTCNANSFRRRLPILRWLPSYKLSFLFNDFLAGITVSLTVIPQGIAYAAVAGLDLQYGLYTAFMAPFMLVLFSSVPEITMGPTAVMAVMTLQYASTYGPEVTALLSFLSGIFILLCGILNLGFLTELISGTVLSAFCSAAAARVIVMQFRTLLGLKFPGNGVLPVLSGICSKFYDTKVADLILGLFSIAFLLVLKNLSPLLLRCKLKQESLHRVAWLLSVSRNAFVIAIGCIVSYSLAVSGVNILTLTGYIQPGVPEFKIPSFTFNMTSSSVEESADDTSVFLNFLALLEEFGLGLGLMVIVAILEHVAIAKSVSSGTGVDSSQELFSLGIANFVGSFAGAFPVTASFSRSAVQKASGVKTPLCSLFTGAVVLLSIAFLTEVFYYIPKVSLAAVIICAVGPMVEFEEVRYLWRVSKIELVPFFTTFLVCFFHTIEAGIIAGALLHLLFVIFHSTRKKPKLTVNQKCEVTVVVQRSLYFSGVEMLRDSIDRIFSKHGPATIVLDMRNVDHIDATSMKALDEVFANAFSKGAVISITGLNQKVRKAIKSGLGEKCCLSKGWENFPEKELEPV